MTRLLRRLIGRPDLTPTPADAITLAQGLLREADRTLLDAAEWLMPPLGPATPEQDAEMTRIRVAIGAARCALEEVTR